MELILVILSLIFGWGIFQKYRSILGVVYFSLTRMIFEYIICCVIALMVLVLLGAVLLLVLKSLMIGVLISGIAFIVIFILEKILDEKMPFGIKDKATHYGLIALCLVSSIGYFIGLFTTEQVDSSNEPVVENITQDSSSDIITIESDNHFESDNEVKQDSSGKYTGVEFVTQYDDVMGIEIITEDRVLIEKEDSYSIYDKKFNEIKSLGNIEVKEIDNEFIFYSQEIFQDGDFENAYGILDKDGNIVQEPIVGIDYDEVESIYNSLVQGTSTKVSVETVWDLHTGLVGLKLSDSEDELLFDKMYPDITLNTSTSGEYAFKDTNGKWGILNIDGEIVLEPKYSTIKYINSDWDTNEPYFVIYNDRGEQGIFTHDGWLFEPQIPYENTIQYFRENVIATDGSKTTIYDQSGTVVKQLDEVYQFTDVIPMGEPNSSNYYLACRSLGVCGITDNEFNWFIDDKLGNNVYILENGVFVSVEESSYEKRFKFFNEDGSMIETMSIILTADTDGFFGVDQNGEVFIIGNTVYKFVANTNYEESDEVVEEEKPSEEVSTQSFTFDTAIEYAKNHYGEDEDTVYSIEDGVLYDETGLGYCVISLYSKSMQEAGGSGFLLRVTVYEDGRVVE